MTVLVTGGAGYIGSHTVYALIERGENVVVLDNLSTGVRAQVAPEAIFLQGDVGDQAALDRAFHTYEIKSVIHFAGSIVVPDSMERPLEYYENNVAKSRTLLDACVRNHVQNFLFSSTATVYADDAQQPLAEGERKNPVSPYARSKLMMEWMLEDVSRATPLRHMALRYFNVAGADPGGRTGQSTPKATHLIKRAAQVALGRVSHLDIFGTDYPTPDGTGVRDYIHVTDLAAAHLLALDALKAGAASKAYNVGYGRGQSVREVIEAVEAVTQFRLPVRESGRRPGDPPILVSDPRRIKRELGWQPCHENLPDIIRSAIAWERRCQG